MRILAALLLFSSIAFGQDCSADGTVVNSVTNAPIARARVSGDKNTFALTDTAGKWSLEHLACGNIALSATRPTFLADRAPTNVRLIAGTPLHDVTIVMVPQAVVTGHIVDDHGDPLPTGQVEIRTSRVVEGTRLFAPKGLVAANDIGEFRAAGLYPGSYLFCVDAGNLHKPQGADPTVFDEQCTALVRVTAGSASSVDFQLTPVSSRHHVRGTISGADGAGLQIVLDCKSSAFSAGVSADGAFDIADAPSGTCGLIATAFVENDRLVATEGVEIRGADVDGIHLHLEKGFSVAGAVRVVSPRGKQADTSRYSVSLKPAGGFGPAPQTIWNEDRTSFTVTNVMPGSYRLQFGAPPPFYVESATLGGRDVIHSDVVFGPGTSGIEVVLSDNSGAMEGTVSVDDRATAAGILLQQEGAQRWLAQADATGRFKIEGLAPGDYRVSAWDDINNVEYANPVWMQLNSKTMSASIQPGLTTQVKLARQAVPNE